MNRRYVSYGNVNEALLSTVPELHELIHRAFGSYYDLEAKTPDESPGSYLIFEGVVQKLVFDLLETNQDERLLSRLFGFFEEMATSTDPNVSRDLLGIAILEPLL